VVAEGEGAVAHEIRLPALMEEGRRRHKTRPKTAPAGGAPLAPDLEGVQVRGEARWRGSEGRGRLPDRRRAELSHGGRWLAGLGGGSEI
jgi:hypothetical protein